MKNLHYIFLLIFTLCFCSSFAQLRFYNENKDDEIKLLHRHLFMSKTYEKKVEIYLGLGQVYDESSKFQSVYYYKNAVLCADSSNVYELRYRARYKVAIEYAKGERFKDAYDKVNEALKLSNDNRNVDDFENAKKLSEAISGKIINRVEQNIRLANDSMNLKNYHGAISTLRQSIQLLDFIQISQNTEYIKKANELSEKIKDFVTKKIDQNIQEANKLIDSKNIQGAISKLEPSVSLADFIKHYNYQYSTRVKLSDAYSLNNQYKKAIITLNEAFDISLKKNKVDEAREIVNLIEKNYNALGENQDVISKIRNDLLDSLKRKIENLKLTKQVDSNLLAEYNDVKRSFSDSSEQIIKKQFNSDLKGRYIELIEQKRRLQRLVYILLISIIFILLAALIAFRAYSIKKKQEIELNRSKKSIEKQALTLEEQNEELISTLDGLANAQNELKERNQEIEKQKELLERASKIITETSARASKDKILAEITNMIKEQLNCRKCSIFWPNREKDFLYNYASNKYLNTRYSIGNSLVGKVFNEGVSRLEDNVYQNQLFTKKPNDNREYRSMLLVPIKTGKRSIAVICADQDKNAYFTRSDLNFVELIASQVANIIERANGFEILQEIGNRILNLPKAGGIKNLLEKIVKEAILLTNTSSGVIYLISDDKKQIIDKFHSKDFDHPKPRLGENGITDQIIETKDLVAIPDLTKNEQINPILKERYKSMIGVPLIFENNVIGVLYLDDKNEHNFNETEILLLKTLVGQATIAIINAQAYEEINDQKEFLRTLVDTIPAPVFYIEKRTKTYVVCNDEYAKIMSYKKKEEIIGKTLSELYNTEKADSFEQRDTELFNNPTKDQSFEDTFKVNGKEKVYKTLKKCIFKKDGEVLGIIGVLWDITDEKEMFEYKKSLLSDIEHEYKTPMAAIQGSAELLEGYLVDSDERIKKHLIRIKSNIEASIQLFEENVKFKPIPSNLFSEIFEIIKDIRIREKISQNIEIVCDEKSKTMPLDMRLIKPIIENIISNAIKYSKTEKDIILLSINYSINKAIITIEDEGIGIPKDTNDKIFKYRYRGTNIGERKGDGTGLAIVKQRVLLHEGNIQYQSKENEGTTFIITLPIINITD